MSNHHIQSERSIKPKQPEFKYIQIDEHQHLFCPWCGKIVMKGVIKAIESRCPHCRQFYRMQAL